MRIFYIPCKNQNEAEKIAKLLLAKKLIGCANIIPATSFFCWAGKIQKAKEKILICKTLKGKFKELERIVRKSHSYSIPFIGAIKIESVNADFLDWLTKQLK